MKATVFPSPRPALLSLLLASSVLILSLREGIAVIDINLQMQLGNPTGAAVDPGNHTNFLILRAVETIGYSDVQGQPIWASWDLTAADVGSSGRTDAWAVDTSLPPSFNRIPTSTYGSVGGQSYDRGHMCPSADRTDSTADNAQVFIMSNIIPQASQQNQGVWNNLEMYSRTLLSTHELLITCGPYNFGPNRVDGGLVGIASNTFKIIVCVPLASGTALSRITNADPNSIRVIAVDVPNTGAVGSTPWTSFVTSTKQVQSKTGYAFFTALPNNLGWVLRSKVDGQTPASPAFISFSPASGPVASAVTLAGANLDTVTNVTFNGTIASYNIDSPTQISAIVPAGASSGPIIVRGLGGNSAGPSNFTLSSGGGPDLTLTTTHAGNFTQGDTADTYTITVTNVGTSMTVGTVSVTNILPASLTGTAISGAGWTGNLATLTATRSDPLAPGAAYPPLILTVNISATAPPTVTNLVTVSGGGETNPLNDTASHLTAINVLPTVSPFPIAAAGFVAPNQFAITWSSVIGRTYQVQSAPSLAPDDWTTNATLTASAASTSWTNAAAYGPAGFYRVVATP